MNVGSYSKVYNLEVYLGNSQTCMMGLFAKLVRDQNPFTFPKALKYWIPVQRGQSYLMGRRCLFSLWLAAFLCNGVTIKIPYGADVLLHRPPSHPVFSYLLGKT